MILTRSLAALVGLTAALTLTAPAPAGAGGGKVVDVELVSVHVVSDGDAIGCGEFDRPDDFWVDDPGTLGADEHGSWLPVKPRTGFQTTLCSGSTYDLTVYPDYLPAAVRLPLSADTVATRVRTREQDGLVHCTANDATTVGAPALGKTKVVELEVSDGCGAAAGIDLRFTVKISRVS